MKNFKIAVIVLVIVIGLSALVYYFPTLFSNSLVKPQAKIEINISGQKDIIINEGDTILFSANNSTDEDGKIENYYWNFGDGTTSGKIDARHKYNTPGIYNVTLTVVDNDGNKDITHLLIRVNGLPAALARISNITNLQLVSIPIYDVIQFNGTGSFDSDGTILSYHWDFGYGNYSTKPSPRHQYYQLGAIKITLTVVDNDGGAAIDDIEIQSILRTYSIEWILRTREEDIEPNGYTFEGESTEILQQINQDKFAYGNITLNWTDRQPLLKNNQSNGEDLFELNILTPENISEIKNSTLGNISIMIDYNLPPSPDYYRAKTANDAITMATDSAGFSDGGNGEWYFNISAIDCKGGTWQNDRFDLDQGNFWSLKIVIFYYELEIYETTYD